LFERGCGIEAVGQAHTTLGTGASRLSQPRIKVRPTGIENHADWAGLYLDQIDVLGMRRVGTRSGRFIEMNFIANPIDLAGRQTVLSAAPSSRRVVRRGAIKLSVFCTGNRSRAAKVAFRSAKVAPLSRSERRLSGPSRG
jgi:hypothetical protein